MPTPLIDPTGIKDCDLFRWADFVELSCLLDADGEAPLGETLREPWGFETGTVGAFLQQEDEDERRESDTPSEDEAPTFNDRLQTKLNDLAMYLQRREHILQDNYPFIFDRGNQTLSLKTNLLPSRQLYLYFLYAANLPFFSASERSSLTTGFERLSCFALKEMVPERATCGAFGTASTNGFRQYTGNIYTMMKQLAEDLNTRLSSDIQPDTFPPTATGDRGLDAVAWFPFDDNAGHQPLFLAQAGCSCDESTMLSKQNDVCPKVWGNRIKHICPVSMLFTPQCYRNADGSWVKPAEIKSIFIDRIRMMLLLGPRLGDLPTEEFPLYNDIAV